MSAPAPPTATLRLPAWAAPIVRLLLSVVLLYIGVSGWADGYGMAITGIASTAIITELIGAGLSQTQAQAAVSWLTSELAKARVENAQLKGAAPSTPPK